MNEPSPIDAMANAPRDYVALCFAQALLSWDSGEGDTFNYAFDLADKFVAERAKRRERDALVPKPIPSCDTDPSHPF